VGEPGGHSEGSHSTVRGGRPGDEVWDLWYPGAGATGISFARAVVAGERAKDPVLVHAAPPRLDVTVRAVDGRVLAAARELRRGEPGPMSYLVREGAEIRLEDGWPSPSDLGRLVILPGGEVGVLTAWWHAEDHSEWTWSVEFHNTR
jgi:hypothetical protein